jgi:hydrogenase maturation protein HypF
MTDVLKSHKSFKITITGLVQGVGFRPYVYVLANQYKLNGSVYNNEEGVIINLSGIQNKIFEFYTYLISNPPEVSKIDKHHIEEVAFEAFDDFKILPSQKSSKLNLLLSPDFAICENCKNEILDDANRRHHYPFTTCVNCGPRWAITNAFPFEREHTTMKEFEMCEDCQAEYVDPKNRRFHSQTNSCSSCGMSLRLTDTKGTELELSGKWIFTEISELLKAGHIIAIKNTGGYLLCCDASNKITIQKLRIRKNRPQKPFAILFPDIDLVKKYATVSLEEEKTLKSRERPIVILQNIYCTYNLSMEDLAPNLNQLGVMLPYSAILELLAKEVNFPIVATSGNIHGSPIISTQEMAFSELNQVADYFLHHNLEIAHPQDDSVLKFSSKHHHKMILRRSRGYAPNSFGTCIRPEKIVAMGSHLKSAIAFKPNDYIYISEYLGNLDNFEVYNRLTSTTEKFMTLFSQRPEVVLVDKHPNYSSAHYGEEIAENLKIPYQGIQHHKAHFTSVLGEHDLFEEDEPILGVIWDGTGYGEDQQIWGGEFFKYHKSEIDRLSQFDYFSWLAGDKMSKEPRLSLLSLVNDELQSEISNRFSTEELSIYETLKKQSHLKTSSVGRLFDAVASLLNICHINSYEGEAAMLMENLITDYDIKECKRYCELSKNGNIPTHLLFYNLHMDVKKGADKTTVIVNFLYTLAHLVFEVAHHQNIKKLAFSGGVFQNSILIDMLHELGKNDYNLFFNCNLSPNDENISYGQIMYYLHITN